MTRIAYVNGRYLPQAEAGVHVEDRGFLFADAVYEVCEVEGALVEEARHLARLERSLAELGIARPMSRAALAHVMRDDPAQPRAQRHLLSASLAGHGAARFLFPPPGVTPTLARSIPPARMEAQAVRGIDVVSTPDIRWRRCDIKTVMLLPACLAKEAARQKARARPGSSTPTASSPRGVEQCVDRHRGRARELGRPTSAFWPGSRAPP